MQIVAVDVNRNLRTPPWDWRYKYFVESRVLGDFSFIRPPSHFQSSNLPSLSPNDPEQLSYLRPALSSLSLQYGRDDQWEQFGGHTRLRNPDLSGRTFCSANMDRPQSPRSTSGALHLHKWMPSSQKKSIAPMANFPWRWRPNAEFQMRLEGELTSAF
jgi:hypothetical protein